jgi:SAM-dependent methyltransferase
VSTWDLGCGLLQRLSEPETHASYVATQSHLRLFSALRAELEKRTEVVENRQSPRGLAGNFGFAHYCSTNFGMPIRGVSYLDVGCGSISPFSRMFAHLMAGASRAACLELDPIQDLAEAVRMLPRIAAAAAVEPATVFAGLPVAGHECLTNVADFDLARLAHGDPGGVNLDRLTYLQRSASDTGLPDASVDVIVSNSVLEHLPEPDATIAELARITKPGGHAMHGIDVADHRWYGTPSLHRLDFLAIAARDKIIHGCNRLRLVDFERLFEKHGFKILVRMPNPPIEIPAELRKRFVEPWRQMPDAQLNETWCQYLLRRG